MAPLMYCYPKDRKTYQLHDQVMLGEWLMAAPVCRPGVEYRAVYFPEGVWYDWRTGDRYEGPSHILAPAPLELMPIYVRGGAIIPMVQVVQYVGESRTDELRLKVWPGSGEFTLYEDDGISRDYQSNQLWAKTTYRVGQDADNIVVEIEGRRGNWNPGQRSIVVEVVGVGEQRFSDDGTALTLVFN
jgi:alpha-glucosidase